VAAILAGRRRPAVPDGHEDVMGPDPFGVRQAPAGPAFLAGYDFRELHAGQRAAFFDRMDMVRGPVVSAADLRPGALRKGPVSSGRSVPRNSGPSMFPKTQRVPHIAHSIWFGGPLYDDGGSRKLFMDNLAAAKAAAPDFTFVAWTDVPRGEIAAALDGSAPAGTRASQVGEMVNWARGNGIRLVNIDEVFSADHPMTLDGPARTERARGNPVGWASASDLARLEILNRFGGVYSDGDNDMARPGGLARAAQAAADSEPGYALIREYTRPSNAAISAAAGSRGTRADLEVLRGNYREPYSSLGLMKSGGRGTLGQVNAADHDEVNRDASDRAVRTEVLVRTGPSAVRWQDLADALGVRRGKDLPEIPEDAIGVVSGRSWLPPRPGGASHAGSASPEAVPEHAPPHVIADAVVGAVTSLHRDAITHPNTIYLPGAARTIDRLPEASRPVAWEAAISHFLGTFPDSAADRVTQLAADWQRLPENVRGALTDRFPNAMTPAQGAAGGARDNSSGPKAPAAGGSRPAPPAQHAGVAPPAQRAGGGSAGDGGAPGIRAGGGVSGVSAGRVPSAVRGADGQGLPGRLRGQAPERLEPIAEETEAEASGTRVPEAGGARDDGGLKAPLPSAGGGLVSRPDGDPETGSVSDDGEVWHDAPDRSPAEIIASYRPQKEKDGHWVLPGLHPGVTEMKFVPHQPSEVVRLRQDDDTTVGLTPGMVRNWLEDQGVPNPEGGVGAAINDYLYGGSDAGAGRAVDVYDIHEAHRFVAALQNRAYEANLREQEQVADAVNDLADHITENYPPDQYVYVGLGRSPAAVVASLQAKGHTAASVPLSSFRPGPSDPGSILSRALVDEDGRPVPGLTHEQQEMLNAHFDEFLGHIEPGRNVVLIDYTESGKSLVAAQHYLQQWAGNRWGGDTQVDAFAMHQDIQTANITGTYRRAGAADTVWGRVSEPYLKPDVSQERAQWRQRFTKMSLGEDGPLGKSGPLLGQAFKQEAFDGLAEYGSYKMLEQDPARFGADRPRRQAPQPGDVPTGYQALTDAVRGNRSPDEHGEASGGADSGSRPPVSGLGEGPSRSPVREESELGGVETPSGWHFPAPASEDPHV
jgi:hypothetical protein